MPFLRAVRPALYTRNVLGTKKNFSTMPATFEAPVKALPTHARVVIIGGGIIGSSTAYHMVRQKGFHGEVVVLERHAITSGTTWHAAGLMCTFGSLSETSTAMRIYTRELYKSLQAETGQETGFRPVGFIECASSKDRLEEYRRIAAFNRLCGVDVHEITPSQIKELFPIAKTDDLLAGFYIKEDGRVNPVDVTVALVKGAKMKGAQFFEGVSVMGVTQANGRVTGVQTNAGNISAEYVINCGGMWGREIGAMAGVNVPLQSAEHYYLITEPIPGVNKDWPVLEDPSHHGYYREEGGGLMVGLFEPEAAAWNVDKVPHDFSFGEITPDWDRMAPFVEKAMSRVPISTTVGVKKFFCGPESFTPDLAPIIGEAPELTGYFVAAGLNSIGILSGGGVGRTLANWVASGRCDMDYTGFNINRLQKYQSNPAYRAARVCESLGLVYKCHYPYFSPKTARGLKKSAFHERLEAAGACFKDVSGWEGADWYAPKGVEPKVAALTWGAHNFTPYWASEHRACREGVICLDMSFMSRFMVQGKDAGAYLNFLSTANVDGDDGVITYCQWLHDDGCMAADVTVLKIKENKFLVIVTDTQHRAAETWLEKHIGEANVVITDVTAAYAQLNVQGPKSRELMQELTSEDLSNEALPFRGAKEIDIGFARAMCVRITYLGELGYELYITTDQARHVYDRVVEVGKKHGLVHCGLKALGSLRCEKGYRDFGHDMDNLDTIAEVGLSFTCDFDKPGGFKGQKAVEAQKAKKHLNRRMINLLVKNPDAYIFHGEPIRLDGKAVGYVRAGSYGHTLGGGVGMAMLEFPPSVNITPKFLEQGKWEVEIAGILHPIQVSLKPLYDPKNDRIKM